MADPYDEQSVGMEGPPEHPFHKGVSIRHRGDGKLTIRFKGPVRVTSMYLREHQGAITIEKSN